ncbi:hypothetical protein [Bradyrhizobium sp. 2TAF24]|uniref:hypothetical protein n=1 Tax=Bradyrhizobium sp. 2TAF24 TaxID=3233011 RepID=UPI003F93A1B7
MIADAIGFKLKLNRASTMQTSAAKLPLHRSPIGIGLMAGPTIVLAVGLLAWLARDPLDRFKVVAILHDATQPRYAVIYHYDHADSSAAVTAAWIASGRPPEIGSTRRPRGGPALVWPGLPDQLRMRWEKDNPRLIAEVDGPAEVHSGEAFSNCSYDSAETPAICVDPKRIEVRSVTPPPAGSG